jgi:DNA replication licensing factor MCM6
VFTLFTIRHEEVDKAKAGDKCLFTGTLIVVPDISQGRAPGPKIDGNSRSHMKSKGGSQESRELDLTRDYNYRLCFLASYVQPSDARVFSGYFPMCLILVWGNWE